MHAKVGHWSKNDEQRLRAFEMKIYTKTLGIPWKDEKIKEWFNVDVTRIVGQKQKGLVEMAKRSNRKLYRHLARDGVG